MANKPNDFERPQGNRPADNARQMTPSILAAQPAWKGSERAGDFLGLNSEPTPAPVVTAPANVPGPRAATDASWLMDVDEPTAPSAARQGWDRDEVAVPARMESAEDQQEDAEESNLPLQTPAVLDASWTEPTPMRRSRKAPMLVGFGVSAALAAAVFHYWPLLVPDRSRADSNTQVAQGPRAIDAPAIAALANSDTESNPIELSEPAPIGTNDQEFGRSALDRQGRAVPVAVTEPAVAEVPQSSEETQYLYVDPQLAVTPAFDSTEFSTVAGLVSTTHDEQSSAGPVQPLEPAAPAQHVDQVAQAAATEVIETQMQPTKSTEAITGFNRAAVSVSTAATQIDAGSVASQAADQNCDQAAMPGGLAATTDSIAASAATGNHPFPRVRVLSVRTQSLVDAANRRPDVDEHRTHVPREVPANVATASAALPETAAVDAVTGDSEPASTAATANRAGSIDADSVLLPPLPMQGVRAIQDRDMQSLWSGQDLPFDRIAATQKVLTPNVGNVRATLKSKAVFEGRLYAVGENSIWLEGPFGRMGIPSDRLDTVEAIAADPEPKPSEPEPDPAAAGVGSEHVQVRTGAGVVVGRLVANNGTKSLVVTDSGLRLTVNSEDVEPVQQALRVVFKKSPPKRD